MRPCSCLLIGLFVLAPVVSVRGQDAKTKLAKSEDVKQALKDLGSAKEPDRFVKAVLLLCEAREEEALDELLPQLLKAKVLDQLDSEKDYRYKHVLELRVTKILSAMTKLPGAKVEKVFASLAKDAVFIVEHKRVDALIIACGGLQKPSEAVLAFLDYKGTPENGATYVVEALAKIHTPDSCALIEQRLLSPKYDVPSKLAWLHDDLLRWRDEPAIVAIYKRLLQSEIKEKDLREGVVQTLFDYRQKQWYPIDSSPRPKPPKWADANSEVLREVLSVGDLADKLEVAKDTKAAVAKARKEIKAILAERENKR